MKKQYVKILDERIKWAHFLRQRFLLVLVLGTLTLLLLFVNKYDTHFLFHEFLTHKNIQYSDGFNENEYFIKTQGCKIPAFEPFSNSVIKFYHAENPIECHSDKNPPLIEADDYSIWIVEKHLKNYKIESHNNFSCCYTAFSRQPSSESSQDDRNKFLDACTKFIDQQNITNEFIRVTCYKDNSEIYRDLFSFVIKSTNISSINFKSSQYPSVLMLGLDAVSRLNFHRTMPKTLEIMKTLDAIEMYGYNKVGDNTYPNLMPVLTGLSEKEVENTCYGNKTSTFDSCHFIWDDFKAKGYYTAFVEDSSDIGLFNYRKNGFAETPTDFYWRTYNRQAIKEIGHEQRMNCHLCLGPRLSVDVLISYTKKLTQAMESNSYFAFVWETSLTHDSLNYPLLGDEQYAKFITGLVKKGLLESTILILMSDHGIRWGKIRSTHQGQVEERLPFLFFVLPESFKKKYPVASYYLRRNSRRLTTPFDLHETLLDIANLNAISDKEIRTKITRVPYMKSRGISLFLPIIGNRTCQSAAIDPHWCTCHQSRYMDANSTTALHVAKIVVDYINTLLADYVQCAKLYLSKIISLSVGESTYMEQMRDIEHIVTDYTIILETSPGNAVFEATVRNSFVGWNLTGTVSRINLYGKQSSCVDDFHLKLYCYCESFIPQLNFF